ECVVNEDGCYTESAGPSLKELPVLSQGSEAVLNLMANDIFHVEEVVHSYPYDWRTKQPVIIRASQQWFVDTEAIKHRAMVKMYPLHGGCSNSGGGLMTQLERRPYWCISRQRVWGVPIPVFYLKSSGKPLINRSLVDRLCQLIDEYGTNFWWTLPLEDIVTKGFLEEHNIQLEEIEQGQDILDIWFDSGLSWYSVLGENKTADMYLEGVDQFTGWFQSSLMTSIALRDEAPYRCVEILLGNYQYTHIRI
ncbi:Isoleucine--tRNA ligase, partial [Blattella germanica]